MKIFRSQKQKQPELVLTRAEALACIPTIPSVVQWEIQESGDVLIEYPFVLKPLLKSIFARFNKEQPQEMTKKLELDGLGSQVWQYIDGKRSVRDIIREFASSSTVTNQEAEQSVTAFLRELGKRGLIVII